MLEGWEILASGVCDHEGCFYGIRHYISHCISHRHSHVANHLRGRFRVETTQGEDTLCTFRHRALGPGNTVGVEGRNGEALEPFGIVFIYTSDGLNEFLGTLEFLGVDTTGLVELALESGIAPIDGDTAGGLCMEILFCYIAWGGVVFVGETELVVL